MEINLADTQVLVAPPKEQLRGKGCLLLLTQHTCHLALRCRVSLPIGPKMQSTAPSGVSCGLQGAAGCHLEHAPHMVTIRWLDPGTVGVPSLPVGTALLTLLRYALPSTTSIARVSGMDSPMCSYSRLSYSSTAQHDNCRDRFTRQSSV